MLVNRLNSQDFVLVRVLPTRATLFVVVLLIVSCTQLLAQEPQQIEDTTSDTSVRPGINKNFLDPKLDVEEWLGRFEIESREVFAAREQVLKICNIKQGQRIADVGAGTGFYSRLFAGAVGDQGWVYSVDISPRFLEHINSKTDQNKIQNVTGVLCTPKSVRLPPSSVDLTFICDTYHHFEYPKATLASIHRALKPGGTLVLIDFEKIEGKTREFLMNHVRADKATFRAEVQNAGFEFVEEVRVDGFEENYLLKFRRP